MANDSTAVCVDGRAPVLAKGLTEHTGANCIP